jgi:hypothetical protein
MSDHEATEPEPDERESAPDDPLLDEQAGKGYGVDEGEREDALDAD